MSLPQPTETCRKFFTVEEANKALPLVRAIVSDIVQQYQTVTELQQAYRDGVGKEVARSTIYRLLQRHGWRKVVPRPRHPKADIAAQAAFKKTAPRGTPRGLAPG